MRRSNATDAGRAAPWLREAEADLARGASNAAQRACRKALALAPSHPVALRLLGLAQLLAGDVAAAGTTLRRAVAGDPGSAEAHYAQALGLRAAGDVDAAVSAYRAALALQPGHALALNNLAGLLLQRGDDAEAWALAARAVAAAPTLAVAHNTLGNAARRLGRNDDAERHYREAGRLDPRLAQAHDNLGRVLLRRGEVAAAIVQFRRALAAAPGYLPALVNLGHALRETDQFAAAVAVWRQVVAADPDDPGLTRELGRALTAAQDYAAAADAYRFTLRARPQDAVALRGLGTALTGLGCLDDARAAYRAASDAAPDWPSPRFHEGVIALCQGDYSVGFALYEQRSGEAAVAGDDPGTSDAPLLTPHTLPSLLAGPAPPVILLRDEQGFGDTMLFARFVDRLADADCRIVLQLRRPLVRLAIGHGNYATIAREDIPPPHDAQARLASLGWITNAAAIGIGMTVPWLRPPQACTVRWAARLAGSRPLVAVAWAGNLRPAHRAIPLSVFAALFDCPGIRFVSVQTPVADADRTVLARHDVADLAAEITDFAETAAILQAADLVISVDTAVANLAGALGRPVWVALSIMADWRWGTAADATPWYPTARLFRQHRPGDWTDVVGRLGKALLAE